MISHLAAYIYHALLNIYIQVQDLISFNNPDLTLQTMSEKQQRLLLSQIILRYLKTPGSLLILITMLIMFYKHSQSKKIVSTAHQKEITRKFMLVFSKLEDLD